MQAAPALNTKLKPGGSTYKLLMMRVTKASILALQDRLDGQRLNPAH
jgi:hypothetical protein